jgi:hypothetical protein
MMASQTALDSALSCRDLVAQCVRSMGFSTGSGLARVKAMIAPTIRPDAVVAALGHVLGS